ncbi:MAG TPA: ATP-binding protein, partial [Methanospirillum sp.]|nr:ATP-binding protein [Methanospirillum sp.]
ISVVLVSSNFKPYTIDIGLRNRVALSFSEDIGWLVENVVAAFLIQQYDDVFFSKDVGESDFVVKEGLKNTKSIQLWYDDPSISDIPASELAGIIGEEKKISESILVTNDYDGIVESETGPVHCIPVTRFLLGLG